MKDKEYHRVYNKNRYYRLVAKLIDLLGGKCVQCGTLESLEFDHIDPAQKSFSITNKILSMSWEKILEEAKKCQLLCEACHLCKTSTVKGKDVHGTLSSYRWCKCDLCRKAKSDHNREYKQRIASVA